jgi:hypothetical protein
MPISDPSNMADAVVVPRADMVAASSDWITVVFNVAAYIDLVLTELAFECVAQSSARIGHIDTFALPRVIVVMTDSLVVTRCA